MPDPIAILGTGMAGLGAAHALECENLPFVCYEKNQYPGGHTRSLKYGERFVFDEGGHISFTKSAHVKDVLARNIDGFHEEKQLKIDNYWHGRRIPHPVQCNLHRLPTDLIVNVITDFVEARMQQQASGNDSTNARPRNYQDWLYATYGTTFAETFPIVYGEKYHTTKMDSLTTDWLGPRMYTPSLDELLRGAIEDSVPGTHYVDMFRYPTTGGFESYLRPFFRRYKILLSHEVTGIDPREKLLRFSNGITQKYSQVISTIPLPSLIPLVHGAPQDVVAASRRLAFTTAVLVNIGLNREDISETAITYFYDEDILASRVNLPHMFSSTNAPPGCGSIQAEVYFSDKYQPLRTEPAQLIAKVVSDLRRCEFILPRDEILFSETAVNRYANVIYDHERRSALATILAFLDEIKVHTCGRYGKWNHAWTDEAFLDGEATARTALSGADSNPQTT